VVLKNRQVKRGFVQQCAAIAVELVTAKFGPFCLGVQGFRNIIAARPGASHAGATINPTTDLELLKP